MNQSLYEIFALQKLSDLIIVGYLDEQKGFKRFNAVMNSIFLIFGERIIQVESYEQYSKIKLSATNESAYSKASIRAEEDELMIFSALDLYTRYETNHIHLESINLFFDQVCDIENGVYRAIGITLTEKAGYLFFDPMNLSGILIGSVNQQESFLKNWQVLREKNGFEELILEIIRFGNT